MKTSTLSVDQNLKLSKIVQEDKQYNQYRMNLTHPRQKKKKYKMKTEQILSRTHDKRIGTFVLKISLAIKYQSSATGLLTF